MSSSNSSEITEIVEIIKESGIDTSGIASIVMSICVGALLVMKIYSWCKKKTADKITPEKIIEMIETVKQTATTATSSDSAKMV